MAILVAATRPCPLFHNAGQIRCVHRVSSRGHQACRPHLGARAPVDGSNSSMFNLASAASLKSSPRALSLAAVCCNGQGRADWTANRRNLESRRSAVLRLGLQNPRTQLLMTSTVVTVIVFILVLLFELQCTSR